MRRGSLLYRVMTLAVDHPGLLDPLAVAERLVEPSTRPSLPYTTESARSAELEARAAVRQARHLEVATMLRRVREAIRGARKAGLLHPASDCRMDPHTLPLVQQHGVGILRGYTWHSDGDSDHRRCIVDAPPLQGHALAIVEELLKGPCTPLELRQRTGGLTPAGNERGAWRRAWDRLVGDGVVVPPTHLWPTPAGIAAALGHRAPASEAVAAA